MTFEWQFTQKDIKAVDRLLDKHKGSKVLLRRVKRNLAESKEEITKEQFWHSMTSMRLTTLRRSGPEDLVHKFSEMNPYPLAYETVSQQEDIAKFVANTLKKHKAYHFYDKVGVETAQNFYRLTEWQMWEGLLKLVNQLITLQDIGVERSISRYLSFALTGIGPKQARNTLQDLGLTRYEIPIDSRLLEWLRDETTFPNEKIISNKMSNPNYYESLLDEIQKLCKACNEYPCLVDAAIFSDADGDGWDSHSNAKRNWPRPNDK